MTERLISADSHVNMSHERVKEHLATEHHDAYDAAVNAFQQQMMATMGAGRANADSMKQNAHAAFTRPGYGDAVERLADMDADGVEAEVVYSEVSGFRYLYMLEDRESTIAATRAFNDAMLDWASVDPARLVVSCQVPVHDVELAVGEVERVAAAGCKSLQLPVFPAELGVPDYYDERYEPLFALVQETGLPICCHIGLNTALDDLARRDPTPQKGVMVPMTGLSTAEAFGMWILGGVFQRFPDLKVVYVEPGLGWVAWYVELVDDMVNRQGYVFDRIDELPSAYFHRNVHLTFIEEHTALSKLRHILGVENLLWSTDYPHPVTSWPDSRELVEKQFTGIPADERALMTSGNAARVWNL
jgi:predicted TIM-barrel fold metal-dependent hydrolase